VFESLHGFHGAGHMAAIPAAGAVREKVTFQTNAESAFGVFAAAAALLIERFVWASSETTLGSPLTGKGLRSRPSRKTILCIRVSGIKLALSKVLGEEMVRRYSRWTGIPLGWPAFLQHHGAGGLLCEGMASFGSGARVGYVNARAIL
jgi:nucleoside-diphosphate-sugar epimerase